MRLFLALSEVSWEVKPFTGEQGCYAAVQPDMYSLFRLMSLCDVLGIVTDPRKFHCTVMYSPDRVPAVKEFNAEAEGYIHEIAWWAGHNNKGYLSALLRSPQLQGCHKQLTDAGAKHTYSPYTPHITLATGPLTLDLERAMKGLNESLKLDPIRIFFDSSVISDIKD